MVKTRSTSTKKRTVKKKTTASPPLDAMAVFGPRSQETPREQSKQEIANDYSKMLNLLFPSDSTSPSISDVSKNFSLKPIDNAGTVFLVVKKNPSVLKKSKSLPDSTAPKTTKNIKTTQPFAVKATTKKAKQPQRKRTTASRKRPRSKSPAPRQIRPTTQRPVRINGKLALEAPPAPAHRKYDIDKLMRNRIPMTNVDF